MHNFRPKCPCLLPCSSPSSTDLIFLNHGSTVSSSLCQLSSLPLFATWIRPPCHSLSMGSPSQFLRRDQNYHPRPSELILRPPSHPHLVDLWLPSPLNPTVSRQRAVEETIEMELAAGFSNGHGPHLL